MALHRDRPFLAGTSVALPLPVPRTIIEAHATRIGIPPNELHEFVEIVAAIDDVYVEGEARRALAEANKPKKG